jgi:hypothetical protein
MQTAKQNTQRAEIQRQAAEGREHQMHDQLIPKLIERVRREEKQAAKAEVRSAACSLSPLLQLSMKRSVFKSMSSTRPADPHLIHIKVCTSKFMPQHNNLHIVCFLTIKLTPDIRSH